MKTCKKCGLEKSPEEFPIEKRNRSGLAAQCRKCAAARIAEWDAKNRDKRERYRLENKGRIAATKAAYYAENSELFKAKAAARRKSSKPEKSKEYFREYASKNSKKIVARVREWRLRNPDRKTVHNQNRRARKLSNGGRLSADIAQRLMVLQRGLCAGCRRPIKKSRFHLDHIMPLSKDGENSDSNVQLLCPTCNTQKHASHPVDFMRRKGFLL